jgi:hypothetical protein
MLIYSTFSDIEKLNFTFFAKKRDTSLPISLHLLKTIQGSENISKT